MKDSSGGSDDLEVDEETEVKPLPERKKLSVQPVMLPALKLPSIVSPRQPVF
jgi:hypothetical protein